MGLSKYFDFHVDYVGQKLADDIYHVILTVVGIVSFIYAYIYQRYSYASYGTIAGFVLASVICLPPWPFYRRHPLNWQKTVALSDDGPRAPVTKSKKKKI